MQRTRIWQKEGNSKLMPISKLASKVDGNRSNVNCAINLRVAAEPISRRLCSQTLEDGGSEQEKENPICLDRSKEKQYAHLHYSALKVHYKQVASKKNKFRDGVFRALKPPRICLLLVLTLESGLKP